MNILKFAGKTIDKTSNPFTRRYGYATPAVMGDATIANVKVIIGQNISAIGFGEAVGTLAENVGTGGLGIMDDPVTLFVAAKTISTGIIISTHGVNDMIKLSKGLNKSRNNR